MDSITILQISEHVLKKSAEMAERDPHGIIITIVSVSVVFTALIVLYYAYSLIGHAVNGKLRRKKKLQLKKTTSPCEEEAAAIAMALDQELNGETYAAIGMALHQYMDETVHDYESYIITIRRK